MERSGVMMTKRNGPSLPILVAGGGIGGLAAAHALALKGLPVRVLERPEPVRCGSPTARPPGRESGYRIRAAHAGSAAGNS